MAARSTALGLVLASFAMVLAITSGTNSECPAGTRVFAISGFHGSWLDGFDVRCTGGEQLWIPPDYNELAYENIGGERTEEDICTSTAGVQSMEWVKDAWYEHYVVQNVSITCMDGATTTFADG